MLRFARLGHLISLAILLLASCGQNGSSGEQIVTLFSIPESTNDPFVRMRRAYYCEFVLPQGMTKSDGSAISFDDIVVPYRYGNINGHEIAFVTYLDEGSPLGKLDATPYSPAVVRKGDIDIEFVGHRGSPFVWTLDRNNVYRPDVSDPAMYQDRYGAEACRVMADFLLFEEALKLDYFSDEDLLSLAAEAEEIRQDPSLWHWSNE